MLALATIATAFAAPRDRGRRTQWWPGERPTPKAAGTLAGQITAITDTTLSVQTEKNGTPIFTINKDTVVRGAKTSVADLKVGDKVEVNYTTLPDRNVWAKVVVVPGEPNSVFGRVAEVSATSITITTERNAQETFGVTRKTQVTVKGEASTLDKVQTGNPVIIHFVSADGGQIARRIRVLAEGVWPNLGGSVSGKVTAIDASSITVETEKSGAQTFGITDKTKVRLYGQEAKLDQIKIGAVVNVGFRVLDNGARVAATIGTPMPVYKGKIESAGTGGFFMTVGDRSVSFVVANDTKIMSHTYVGTLADLVKGYTATVHGIPGETSVRAFEVEFNPPTAKGTVVSVNGNNVVIKTAKQRVVTAVLSPATVILVRPRTAPNHPGTAADLQPGVAVNVAGHRTGESALNALWMDVIVP